VLVQDALKQLH
jgi:ERI1 exoribonuclease 3